MATLTHRLTKLEQGRAAARPWQSHTVDWQEMMRSEDWPIYFSTLDPEELAALEDQAERELNELMQLDRSDCI